MSNEDKTKVNHVDIAKSEVVKLQYEAETAAQKEKFDEIIADLNQKQDKVRQIPQRGFNFKFECTGCGKDYIDPPSLPSEECAECGSMVHMVEMPRDVWDDKYEVVRK